MEKTTLSGTMPTQNFIWRFVVEKRKTIVEIISALFILLFVYTGINKFISANSLQIVLKDYPLIGGMPELIAWGLPVVELSVALLLFIPRTRLKGLYCSLLLMSAFTLYLIYMLTVTTKLPCTCGGMLQKLTWNQHLFFNISCVLLSIAGIYLKKHNPAETQTLSENIVFT